MEFFNAHWSEFDHFCVVRKLQFLHQWQVSFQSPSPTTAGSPSPDSAPASSPAPILIRASNGKSKQRRNNKIKLSTIVDQLDRFFTKYADVVKGGATALKKRNRSGRKKATKAKKKGKAGGGTNADKK